MTTPVDAASPKQKDKIDIYFLSSPDPQDVEACQRLHKFLAPVIKNLPIEIYSDYSIPAGADIPTYKEMLYHADIVLAFGSSDLIDNEETYSRVQKVILKRNNNEIILMAILVRNFLFDEPPFSLLPLLPTNHQPLNNRKFWDIDEAYTTVGKELRDAIKQSCPYYLMANRGENDNQYDKNN